ncbi:hypothetical protein [Luteibaculum oceani]|uniref:Uncharacterized protein n=1 Tax=Luteibaculum oceani TaxID=1294296 RepID=A0A5C6VBX0_9FLAO|nr:hypothetical protein [Luteibaculum oceani]TXC81976.1 hypothetical protein FRX97_02480 [Luteibaculum oceani]
MKNFILYSLIGLFLCTACKKEENNQKVDTTNSIQYDNKVRKIGYTKVTTLGRPDSTSSLYEFEILLADNRIKQLEEDSFAGIGDFVNLHLYASELNAPDIGVYKFDDPIDSIHTFYAEYVVDYNVETDQSVSTLAFISGTMEIKSITENTFSIQIDGLLSNNKTLSLNYFGVYDENSDVVYW